MTGQRRDAQGRRDSHTSDGKPKPSRLEVGVRHHVSGAVLACQPRAFDIEVIDHSVAEILSEYRGGAPAERVRLDMMCRHGDENGADAKATLTAARKILGNEPGDEFLLSGFVFYLEHAFGASIEDIAADMWARVTVQSCGARPARVSCECDVVEDGLAAILLWFAANRTDQLAEEESASE